MSLKLDNVLIKKLAVRGKLKDIYPKSLLDKHNTPCVPQLSVFLSCLKASNFSQGACLSEFDTFCSCFKKAMIDKKKAGDNRQHIDKLNRLYKKYPIV